MHDRTMTWPTASYVNIMTRSILCVHFISLDPCTSTVVLHYNLIASNGIQSIILLRVPRNSIQLYLQDVEVFFHLPFHRPHRSFPTKRWFRRFATWQLRGSYPTAVRVRIRFLVQWIRPCVGAMGRWSWIGRSILRMQPLLRGRVWFGCFVAHVVESPSVIPRLVWLCMWL